MRAEFLQLQIPLPIAIVGLGLSGESAKKLLLALGVEERQILTFDQKGPADFQDPTLLMEKGRPRSLCVSPGVPLQQNWLQNALVKGARLTSEMEIAFSCLTTEEVISITGSVGKSTTTSILGAGAKAIDENVFVGGNLGTPLADYAREILSGQRNKARYVILELSSYQLENFRNLKSKVSLLTHLSPNHLERYENLNHYYVAKMVLFKHTTEFGILNRSGGQIASLIDAIQKTNPKIKYDWTDRNDPKFKNALSEKPGLVGTHNQDNLAMAFATARYLKWPQESFQAMLRFRGLAHRLENCGRHREILFLNDSKSTTIDSVLQALSSVRQEYPQSRIQLLLGGKDKNLPWKNLAALKSQPDLIFSFFGEVGPLAQSESTLAGEISPTLGDCLAKIKTSLQPGDIVLLSPGGTSWDEFKNFEERGRFFKNWILMEFQDHKA